MSKARKKGPRNTPLYKPEPIDTSQVKLGREILELRETLARNSHDLWACRRLSEGWRYGPRRNDSTKEHPSLIPYEELPESEKEYDRSAALDTLKAIVAMGYKIEKRKGPAAKRRTHSIGERRRERD